MHSTETTLLDKTVARWAGHVLRMNDHCNPKLFQYGKLAKGKRQVGRPKLRSGDNLRATFESSEVFDEAWEDLALDGR